ncbi:MAG: hypothetical protein NFW16_21010 [Candidatus Accumulibacter sp.]|uniref:hypothetical protein n=1 Tax=Accumulibacter sp. TaxID=2053492 RepID=UPI002587B2AA|nr:hypothetical protein [Accumulibacter sp.]MCM8624146.1 hypothetical protein [Accumulibacter sp.]
MMFDPWTASFTDAREENRERAKASGSGIVVPGDPLYQWQAARQVEFLRPDVEGGDGFAVLRCIRICTLNRLVAPRWLADAFGRRFDAVDSFQAGSWDDPQAFGRTIEKGKHLGRRREDLRKRVEVFYAVLTEIEANPDTPVDKGLFECVGARVGVCGTRAERLYYEHARSVNFDAIQYREIVKIGGIT